MRFYWRCAAQLPEQSQVGLPSGGKAATGGEANSLRRGQEPGSEPATNIENKY